MGVFGRLSRAVLRQEVGDGGPYQDLGSPDDVDRRKFGLGFGLMDLGLQCLLSETFGVLGHWLESLHCHGGLNDQNRLWATLYHDCIATRTGHILLILHTLHLLFESLVYC